MNGIRYGQQRHITTSQKFHSKTDNSPYFPRPEDVEHAITPAFSQEELGDTGMNDNNHPTNPDPLNATNLEEHNHIYDAARADAQLATARNYLFGKPDNFSLDKVRDHFNAFVNMSKRDLNSTDLIRNIHRRNLNYLKVNFPDNEIEVDKENYALLLIGYRFFNKEKFKALPQMIPFGKILDAMNIPTSRANINIDRSISCSISRIMMAHYALARQELVEYLEARSIETSAEILRLYDECTRF